MMRLHHDPKNDVFIPPTSLQNFVFVTTDAQHKLVQWLHHHVDIWQTWKFRHRFSNNGALSLVGSSTIEIPKSFYIPLANTCIVDFCFASFLASVLKLDLRATEDNGNRKTAMVVIPKAKYVKSGKPLKTIGDAAVIYGEHADDYKPHTLLAYDALLI